MIWILLYGLIFGTSGNLMVLPKFDKYAKQHIENKERLEKVLDYRKELKAHRKAYQKTYKKTIKDYHQLERDITISGNSIESHILDYHQKKRESLLIEIDSTIAGKSYITESEWQNILVDLEKDISKLIKIQDKQKAELIKQWGKINDCLITQDKQLSVELASLKQDYMALFSTSISLQLPSNKKLTHYHLNREELILLLDEMLETEREILNVRLITRDILIKNNKSVKVSKALKHLTKMPF